MNRENDSPRVTSAKVTMPSGGGALRGINEPFKAQLFTGSGGFSIPFPLPDARGFSPEISLSYNSGSGNGFFGLGFSVSLDSVARKTSNGIPRYNDSDVFILNSAGELLPKYTHSEQGWVKSEYSHTIDSTTWNIVAYRPRLEGAFALIEQWTDTSTRISHWKVVSADNITSLYGISDNGRLYHPQHPQQIFEWLIEESYDPHGNKIIYHYKPGDTIGIPDTIYNAGRDFASQRYPDKIQYANYFITENSVQEEHFAFEIIFDYGQLNKTDPDAPPGQWRARPDPFSSYKSGFELRTARLCYGIYLRHCLTEEFNGIPFTTAALLPEYNTAPVSGFSMVKNIFKRGYRIQQGRPLWIADTPVMELSYQEFNPLDSNWQLLEADTPGYLDSKGFIPVDLDGIGVDGLLYSSDTFTGYLEPLGNGRYAPMRLLDNFPVFHDLQSGDVNIASLDGNSVLDLVVSNGLSNGFFEQTECANWKPFQPFENFPEAYLSPEKEMVDLSGTGRNDLLFFDNNQLKFYASEGKAGYAEASFSLKPALFPATGQQGSEELCGFSDFLGDGLSHRFCLCNGSLTVWPCLGHGNFGEALTFANAPLVDGLFDASRVFLIDADGSGATDIVYCYPGYARIWFNRCGNTFSDPVDVHFPATYSAITAITAGDVSGYGTTSLIFTIAGSAVKHLYYDFSDKRKPYLLQTVDNGTGGLTSLTYTTSVLEQLRDKQEGRTWPTRLPIAVSVVSESKVSDQITGAVYTQRYRYHDGYFDTVERMFRGFGFVESWDCETYEQFQDSAAHNLQAAALLDKNLWVPPIYMRSWFITGAYEQTQAICAQYETQFYQGDAQQWRIPIFELETAWSNQDALSVKQAYAALAGQAIRTEVYAEDHSSVAENPYTVSMSTVQVRLVQPRINGRYCSAMPLTVNELSYAYDRNPEDPRISQNLVLSVDEYGHPLWSAAISFPRRNLAGAVVYPEQQQLRVIATEAAYINTINKDTGTDSFWQYLGVNWQTRKYEIGNISAPADAAFTQANLLQQVQIALQHPVGPVDEPPVQAWNRLLSWSRDVYWNDDGTTAQLYGQINELALLHHAEAAVLDPDEVTRSFGDKVSDELLSVRCGYVLSDGYWWNYGQMQLYNWSRMQFYLPLETKATITGVLSPTVLDESGFNGYETVQYDPYYLMITKTSYILSGTVSIDEHHEYDYQTMSMVRTIDANNNVSEVLYDPLGRVIATTVYGQINGADTGDLPMDQYIIQPEATFDEIIATPSDYLQGATTYFYYDLYAWKNRQQPLNAICIARTMHVHEPDAVGEAAGDTQMPISIAYSDGLGAILQSKAKTTPGEVTLREVNGTVVNPLADPSTQERWLVSGHTVYNNKGMPVEQYQPYFSATPYFEDQQEVIEEMLAPPPTVIHYDPAGRVIRSESPKGFFSKSVYTPWETSFYDFNDTVTDSPYYQWFMANYPSDPELWQEEELKSLHAALPCYNTPAKVVMDNLGNPIRTIGCNLGAIAAVTIPEAVADPMTPEDIWNALQAAGYLAKQNPDDEEAWVTAAFQPYRPGFHQTFLAQFPGNGERLEDYLTQSCMTTLGAYDIQGHQLYNADPRLFLKMVREDTILFNFRSEYGLDGQVLQSENADAGTRWTLSNMAGNAVCSWDSRGFSAENKYDNLQRPLGMYVSGGDQQPSLANWVQLTVYGESVSNAANYNLMGKPYQDFDESGLSIIEVYDLAGAPLQGKTYLRPDYKTESNWTQQAQQEILSAPCYTRSCVYNALGEVIAETLPDGSQQAHVYDLNGLLLMSKQKAVNPASDETPRWHTVIKDIVYNANGKRTSVAYENGVVSSYTYDALTQQIVRTYTTRNVEDMPEQHGVLQDIYYTYDPAGHTISAIDQNDTIKFYNSQKVVPRSNYTYDPLYRVICAEGRTLPGLNVPEQNGVTKNSLSFPKITGTSDLQNLENYRQRFSYDFGNNLILKRHIAVSGNWSQVMTVADRNNHLDTMYVGNPSGRPNDLPRFQYDENGNMRMLDPNGTAQLNWNYLNHISSVVTVAREVTDPRTGETCKLNDAEYYQYNTGGNRVRKVTERAINGGAQIEYTEKIYLGNYQQSRAWILSASATPITPSNLQSEKHTILLNDGDAPALITHIWAIVPSAQSRISAGDIQYRYQLCDPLGSVTMEVNEMAELLTFEQYYVYGGTSFALARSQLEADSKERRFCGKERDAVTGLYYYGARYYASWLCRWMSPDPAGPVDGPNLYEYVSSNPVTYNDPTGLCGNMPKLGKRGSIQQDDPSTDDPSAKAFKRNFSTTVTEGRITKKAFMEWERIGPETSFKSSVLREGTQDDLTGRGAKHGKKAFNQIKKKITKAEKGSYANKTEGKVVAFMKVNGTYFTKGQNAKAALSGEMKKGIRQPHFPGMGSVNHAGQKDNPHAEDWTIATFRNAVDKSGKTVKDYLMDLENKGVIGPRGVNGASNKGLPFLFSMRINFSPCLGCVNSIIAFNNYLKEGFKDEKFILRVKFYRTYELPENTVDENSTRAKVFKLAMDRLSAEGIHVGFQTDESLRKQDETIGFERASRDHIKRLYGAEFYNKFNMGWPERGISRKHGFEKPIAA